jgi:hypothetical protein
VTYACLEETIPEETAAMPLFAKNKDLRVQSFVLKLVNNNCPELKAMMEGPRKDTRVNLVMVVMVIPLEGGHLQVQRMFSTVTKEFSGTGVALVLDQTMKLDEVILAFRCDGQMTYVRARARHLSPMGGGFYQLGFRMTEIVTPTDFPKLSNVSF